MGLILSDCNIGVHCEVRSKAETVVLYSDDGEERIELERHQLAEAVALLLRALNCLPSVPKEATP